MSYCRFGDADVYVYMDLNGSLACCGCILESESSLSWFYDSTAAMVAHLAEHRAAGHAIPDDLEADLLEDDADNFPRSCAEGHVWGEPFHPYPEKFPTLLRVNCRDCDWLASWPTPSARTRKAKP